MTGPETPPPSPPTAGRVVRWLLGVEWRGVVGGAITGAVWMIALAAVPIVLGRAIDGAVDGGDTGDVAIWSLAIVGAVGVGAAAGVVRHRLAVGLHVRTTRRVERAVTARMLDPRGGPLPEPGPALALATTDAERIGHIADLMCRGVGSVVTLVGVGAVMMATAPVLATLVLVGVAGSLATVRVLWMPAQRRAAEQRTQLALGTSTAADVIHGLRTVRGLGAEAVGRQWFATSTRGIEAAGVAVARVGGVWLAVFTSVPGVFLAVVILVGGLSAASGGLSPGELVAFTGLATFLATPLATLAEVGVVWTGGLSSARHVAALLGTEPAVDDPPHAGTYEATHCGDALRLERVAVAGLRGVDLAVERGELVGVVADDAEADALLALLARRRDPDAGAVLLAGVDLRDQPIERVRAQVLVEDAGRPWLRSGSVAENLDLPPGSRDETPAESLHHAAVDELRRSGDPAAVEVGERGTRLSGGQRQRLVVARALRADPELLVLRDPTGALDAVTEARSVERLRSRRRDRTTLVLSTSAAVLSRCDRVAFVHGGVVSALGTHAELSASDGRYRRTTGSGP